MESDSANYKEADTETDNPVISVMVSAMSVQVYRVTVADQEPNLCQIGSETSSKQSMNTSKQSMTPLVMMTAGGVFVGGGDDQPGPRGQLDSSQSRERFVEPGHRVYSKNVTDHTSNGLPLAVGPYAAGSAIPEAGAYSSGMVSDC